MSEIERAEQDPRDMSGVYAESHRRREELSTQLQEWVVLHGWLGEPHDAHTR